MADSKGGIPDDLVAEITGMVDQDTALESALHRTVVDSLEANDGRFDPVSAAQAYASLRLCRLVGVLLEAAVHESRASDRDVG